MARRRCTDAQIVAALRRAEAGTPVAEICRTLGIAPRTFARWRSRRASVDRVGQLERENRRLKRRTADLESDKRMLQRILRYRD